MRRTLVASFAITSAFSTLPTAAVLTLVPLRGAQAQTGVAFSPAGGSYAAGTQLGVSIGFCANPEQYFLWHSVTVNGVDRTTDFPITGGSWQSGCVYNSSATGTITLAAGSNTVVAGVRVYYFDGADVYYETEYWNSTVYTGTETTPPTVTLLAPAGPVPAQYPTITIQWCDNASLNASSRSITINGVNRTADFSYAAGGGGCSVAYQSTSSAVPLNWGSNPGVAYICDNAGNCTSQPFTLVRAVEGAPTIALRNFNGDNPDRGLCLTVGAGQAAALSCGDLVVTHSMPAYRTMGRDRSLTLIYNSATAAPRPVVAAWVTQPSANSTPVSTFAQLTVNGAVRASATYDPVAAGTTRQVALSFDASDLTTGIYPFTLLVQNQYPSVYATTVSGELLIVNRTASEFGAGWWIAGLERIQPVSGNRRLWISGDGSVAMYNYVNDSTWVRASGAFRDTLTISAATNRYTRWLRHGVRVIFDDAGRHVETWNRAGHRTRFYWDWLGSNVRLLNVFVPPEGQPGTTYTLGWEAGTYLLDAITDPAGRVLNATTTAGNLVQLTDPDNVAVQFTYDGARRMDRRVTRRGYS